MTRRLVHILFIACLGVFIAGCDMLFPQLGATEFGLVFRKLPPNLFGGVSERIVNPGERVLLWPWDELYRFNAGVRYVTWGAGHSDANATQQPVHLRGGDSDSSGADLDLLYTRSLDGNEVALSVTIQYRVSPEPAKLARLLKEIAQSDEAVAEVVLTFGRADIRTYMNELRTSDFFSPEARYRAILKTKDAMNAQFEPFGIEILDLILNEHRFERLLPDGTIDRSYQQKIDDTQRLREETEGERRKINTVKAQKEEEFNQTQAAVNRVIAEAEGYKRQAALRGNAYYSSKQNEAKGILAKGTAEVEGIVKQVAALAGAGGLNMLKLEIARQLVKSNAGFVTLGDGEKGLDVRRLDTNQLLESAGIIEALREGNPAVRGGSASGMKSEAHGK